MFLRLAALALVGLASCAGYQVVERSPAGGTISLHGDRDDALDQAKREMEAECHGPFTIVDEGEATADPKRTKEWRVRFVCDRAEPSGA